MAFGMDYEKILRRHVLEEELRGGTDAVKDADLKLTAPPIKPQNKTNTTKLWWDAIMNDRSVAAAALVRQRNVDVDAREGRDLAVPHAPRGRDAGDEDDPRRRGVAVVDLVADLHGAVEVVGALAVAEGRHGVMFLREVLEIGRF